MATAKPAASMSSEEKFLFDLEGYLVVRGVFSEAEVAAANAAIDAHRGDIQERRDPELRNSKRGTHFAGDGESPRCDLGGILGWPKPHCDVFRSVLAHPGLLPYLTALCGQGYRLDHSPFVITQNKGSEGFCLHGGPLTGEGAFNPTLQYRCVNGQMFNSLLAVSVALTDHQEGKGGFCVLPGSHKMNFPVPQSVIHGRKFRDHLVQPALKAGDVVLFSEATVHGAFPWMADHERRIALYRFAPPNMAYGRAYAPSWPREMLEGLTPVQQAVMLPPFAVRLERPLVKPDEEAPTIDERAAKKKKFDEQVFGTSYF